MSESLNTGKLFKVVETNNVDAVNFAQGQFIIHDDGRLFYDSSVATSVNDRIQLTDNNKVTKIVRNDNVETDEQLLNSIQSPTNGDICIICRNIILDKYEFKGYIRYDEWIPLSSDYTVDNIYFNEDIVGSVALGGKELNENGVCVYDFAGKSVKDAFIEMLAPTIYPTVVQPSAKFTYTNGENGAKLETKYEKGTTINPAYKIVFDKGSYSFGPSDTGVVPTYKVIDSKNNERGGSTGVFNSIILNDDYSMTATVNYTGGDRPNTSPTGTSLEHAIVAGSISDIFSISSFYSGGYYGSLNVDNPDNHVIDNSNVRTLLKSMGDVKAGNKIKFTINSGSTVVYVLVANGKNIKSVYNSTVYAEMLNSFIYQNTITIYGGANVNAGTDSSIRCDYKVYKFVPAEAYSELANIEITIG